MRLYWLDAAGNPSPTGVMASNKTVMQCIDCRKLRLSLKLKRFGSLQARPDNGHCEKCARDGETHPTCCSMIPRDSIGTSLWLAAERQVLAAIDLLINPN